ISVWSGGRMVWAAAALDRALPPHTYRIAYSAFRTVIYEMVDGLVSQGTPDRLVGSRDYDDEEEGIWVRVTEWNEWVCIDGWDARGRFDDLEYDGWNTFPGFKPISFEHVLAMERRWSKSGKSVPIFARLGRRADLGTGN